MSRIFSHCITIVLGHEGVYSNDARDPGGATRYGITQRTLEISHAKYPDLRLPLDVADLTREQAIAIYHAEYWRAVRGDELPQPLALIVFDAAVNQGPSFAVRSLQIALGVNADGALGPVTIAAAQDAVGHVDHLVREVSARRGFRYAMNPNIAAFGLGWFRRLVDVTDHSLRLCREPAV